MKLKPIRAAILTLPNGTNVHVERIGKGRYSTAWKNGSSVYVQTHEKDLGKEILCRVSGEKHLPTIEHLEDEGIYKWYRMPLYSKLTAQCKEAWADYRHLQRLQGQAFTQERESRKWNEQIVPASVNDRLLALVQADFSLVEKGYADAIESLEIWCSTYGESWLIEELQARNCAVDSRGELILLDPIFDLAELRAEQDMRQKKQRGY